MYNLSTLQGLVYRDLNQAATSNDRLPAADITAALNNGYRSFARETKCLKNSLANVRQIVVVDSQAEYDFPPDMFEVYACAYGSTQSPLRVGSTDSLTYRSRTWRTTAAGTPEVCYIADEKKLGLYPKPSVSGSVYLRPYGFIIPYSIGGGIATCTRTGGQTTFNTNNPHGLVSGVSSVRIGGVDAAGGGSFYQAAITVLATPTATSYTITDAQGSDTGTGGVVSYADGAWPLATADTNAAADNSDCTLLHGDYPLALVDWAVAVLSSRAFVDEQEAAARATTAMESYRARVKLAQEEFAG